MAWIRIWRYTVHCILLTKSVSHGHEFISAYVRKAFVLATGNVCMKKGIPRIPTIIECIVILVQYCMCFICNCSLIYYTVCWVRSINSQIKFRIRHKQSWHNTQVLATLCLLFDYNMIIIRSSQLENIAFTTYLLYSIQTSIYTCMITKLY